MKQPLPALLRTLIKQTILGYLHGVTEAFPTKLTEPTRVQTHGCSMGGELVRCLIGSQTLPEGTEGYVVKHPNVYYSAYQQIGDEDYPASGATIYMNKCSYSFVTVVYINGCPVLADAFKTVEFDPPLVLGTVA